MKIKILFLALAAAVISAATFRQLTLYEIDCSTCRNIIALTLRPKDINEPIAFASPGMQSIEIRPRYVGYFTFNLYSKTNFSVTVACPKYVNSFVSYPQFNTPIFGKGGISYFKATIFISPALIDRRIILCSLDPALPPNARMEVTRFSEL